MTISSLFINSVIFKSSKENFIQESLDCRDGIKEIEMRNVDGLITFDNFSITKTSFPKIIIEYP